MSRIAFVVCGNGFGHLRRVTEVITELHSVNQRCEILILGASHHEKILRTWKWLSTVNARKIKFVSAGLERNLTTEISDGYSMRDYQNSLHPVFSKLKKFKPGKIVSDNLVGILQEFPLTTLMGSFLWPDCLLYGRRGSRNVAEISRFEFELLRKIRPRMIGLEDMAMPEVRKRTDFKGLPWFCNRKNVKRLRRRQKSMPSVLITGGGTGNAHLQLVAVANHLIDRGDVQIFVDKLLYSNFHRPSQRVNLFDFEKNSFETIDRVICRPGLGILTEAVKYCIPVCSVTDHDKEMIFNAKRIQELGMGIRINQRFKRAVDEFIFSSQHERVEKIENLNTDGAKAAAHILLA